MNRELTESVAVQHRGRMYETFKPYHLDGLPTFNPDYRQEIIEESGVIITTRSIAPLQEDNVYILPMWDHIKYAFVGFKSIQDMQCVGITIEIFGNPINNVNNMYLYALHWNVTLESENGIFWIDLKHMLPEYLKLSDLSRHSESMAFKINNISPSKVEVQMKIEYVNIRRNAESPLNANKQRALLPTYDENSYISSIRQMRTQIMNLSRDIDSYVLSKFKFISDSFYIYATINGLIVNIGEFVEAISIELSGMPICNKLQLTSIATINRPKYVYRRVIDKALGSKLPEDVIKYNINKYLYTAPAPIYHVKFGCDVDTPVFINFSHVRTFIVILHFKDVIVPANLSIAFSTFPYNFVMTSDGICGLRYY